MMKVHADLTIITSLGKLTTDIETYICIAETVIVGDVPLSALHLNDNPAMPVAVEAVDAATPFTETMVTD